ncbi:MAG: prolipoprotein diacylglyceryl transferase [Betaproteobacteria bacterium]|nr:prolipoprotein diacylglyceryl transferase [Betaproteobacteria bacterium]
MHSLTGPAPHLIAEVLAYFVAARVYWQFSRKSLVAPATIDRFCLLAAAVFGAAIGSKGLHVLEHLPFLIEQNKMELWIGGKSVLGGFLGGTLAVEIAKRMIHWTTPTGDPWVPALAMGLFIGRIGCQLSGTWDTTYGIPTGLPWAWDYGDGVGRHPTALYEMLLVAGLFALVWRSARLHASPGARFAAFLLGYCAIRLLLEFLKPPFGAAAINDLPVELYLGLTAIQWAAIVGMIAYSLLLRTRLAEPNVH